jgi:ketosteroid isomerase-like protein
VRKAPSIGRTTLFGSTSPLLPREAFRSCDIDILEGDLTINGDMGIVCTIQRVHIVLKNGDTKRALVRQTDCFERRGGEWKLIHEHASFPAGGEWDGKITMA